MKTLLIIRHAKSSWSNPDLQDFDRPLNNRGSKDVKMMAHILAERVGTIDLILTSTAKRALATTSALIRDEGIDYKELKQKDNLYHASALKIRTLISQQVDLHESIAIVGHNPGLTNLSNEIGNVSIDNVPTTGILAFEFDIENWQDILKKDGKLLFFEYPKRHKAKKVK